jgi:hypothetical protein
MQYSAKFEKYITCTMPSADEFDKSVLWSMLKFELYTWIYFQIDNTTVRTFRDKWAIYRDANILHGFGKQASGEWSPEMHHRALEIQQFRMEINLDVLDAALREETDQKKFISQIVIEGLQKRTVLNKVVQFS